MLAGFLGGNIGNKITKKELSEQIDNKPNEKAAPVVETVYENDSNDQ